MTARGVSTRFGCFLLAAGITVYAQYRAELPGPVVVDQSGRPVSGDARQGSMLTGNSMSRGSADLPRASTPAGRWTVSLTQLAHNVPSKAQKEYDRATVELAKEHIVVSVLRLERAVEMDPEFVEAYNRLYELSLGEGRHVSAKVREFVAIALLCFRGSERPGLVAHMRRAMEFGATPGELFEVLEACVVPGGAPTFHRGLGALMEVVGQSAGSPAR